jgi:hypothetical protein
MLLAFYVVIFNPALKIHKKPTFNFAKKRKKINCSGQEGAGSIAFGRRVYFLVKITCPES